MQKGELSLDFLYSELETVFKPKSWYQDNFGSSLELEEIFKKRYLVFQKINSNEKWKKLFTLLKYFSDSFETSNDLAKFYLKDTISLESKKPLTKTQSDTLLSILELLTPWKKGPFNLFETEIDSEWRSELKFSRIKSVVENSLRGKRVLDIGANNGYYSFRLQSCDPALTVLIDPSERCFLQYLMVERFIRSEVRSFELIGHQDLEPFKMSFDMILCMGILYHTKNPLALLKTLKDSLDHKGNLILETLIFPGQESNSFFVPVRYQEMKNVYFIPTLNCLINWLKRVGFLNIDLVSLDETTSSEQRATKWSNPKSLEDFLDKSNSKLTVEGYPSPIRVVLRIER